MALGEMLAHDPADGLDGARAVMELADLARECRVVAEERLLDGERRGVLADDHVRSEIAKPPAAAAHDRHAVADPGGGDGGRRPRVQRVGAAGDALGTLADGEEEVGHPCAGILARATERTRKRTRKRTRTR